MRIFFSVGEPSGDLHAANLIHDLKLIDPTVECVGFGGPKMKAAGCDLQFELTALAVMFLRGVLANLFCFLRLLRQADRYLEGNRVDAVVLVDYPGFNWWIARKAKKHGVPVFYYGVPQMWAWAPWRVKKLRKLIDWSLCKLPFEVSWFEQRGCRAHYVGHPYLDELARQELDKQFIADYEDDSPLLAILPGSRDQEVVRNLDWLLEAAQSARRRVPRLAVAVACYKTDHAELVNRRIQEEQLPFDVMVGRTSEIIDMADVALACSGSVSLELLHRRKPSVIVYRIGPVKWLLQSLFLRCKFITLVNLLCSDDIERDSWRPVDPDAQDVAMPEYLRVSNCAPQMADWVVRWLTDDHLRDKKIKQLDEIADRLGELGASMRAARWIVTKLGGTSEMPVRRAA